MYFWSGSLLLTSESKNKRQSWKSLPRRTKTRLKPRAEASVSSLSSPILRMARTVDSVFRSSFHAPPGLAFLDVHQGRVSSGGPGVGENAEEKRCEAPELPSGSAATPRRQCTGEGVRAKVDGPIGGEIPSFEGRVRDRRTGYSTQAPQGTRCEPQAVQHGTQPFCTREPDSIFHVFLLLSPPILSELDFLTARIIRSVMVIS